MKSLLLFSLLVISTTVNAGPRSDFETQAGQRIDPTLKAQVKLMIESNYKLNFDRMKLEIGNENYYRNERDEPDMYTRDFYALDSLNTCKVTLINDLSKTNVPTPTARNVKCYKK